jgi:hypothetical protein
MPKAAKQDTVKVTDSIALDNINELLGNHKKLWWLNFKTGLIRGFSGVLGAALAIVIIGFLVAQLGGLPWIGEFFKKIGEATQAK